MAGKSGFMKDAFILFAITLISGIALGGVYEVTKGPIEQATIEANNKTYRGVFPEASSFEETSDIDLEACNTELAASDFGGVGVETVMVAKDDAGSDLGYVINSIRMTATAVKYLSPSESRTTEALLPSASARSAIRPVSVLRRKRTRSGPSMTANRLPSLLLSRVAMRATPRSMRSAVQRLHPTQ